ncbi:MAG: hypothetical protein HFG54_12530 [Lachnospiraceae bacterium]|nr:hypothetical protein [Lachnospiraceae bacterium]
MEELAAKYNIKNWDEDIFLALSDVRKPLYLIRGKPITIEQVKELITGEEPLFGKKKPFCFLEEKSETKDGLLGKIFYRDSHLDWLNSWVYTDGTIGGSFISSVKYPEPDEIALYAYEEFAKKYPFLDMVIACTLNDQWPCFYCWITDRPYEGYDGPCRCRDCASHLEKIMFYDKKTHHSNPDFEELYYRDWSSWYIKSDIRDSVGLTLWIHDGQSEILCKDEARLKFHEYNTLYYKPEYAFMFASSLYRYKHTCICDKKFVEDCFAYIGKPKSLCDEYVEKGYILPFHEKDILVTKDWVTKQYNTYIAGK